MPISGKRRKGKQGGRSAPSSTIGSSNSVSFVGQGDEIEKDPNNNEDSHSINNSPEDISPDFAASQPSDVGIGVSSTRELIADDDVSPQDPLLVLTSEKRRGVYECDYCHADISQAPRIRCAVCPDFDLCLTCFSTVDHKQAIQRLKAQATAHQAVGTSGGEAPTGDGNTLVTSGVNAAALGHNDSHGYRVCDSTRYPLFPTQRNLNLKGVVQSVEDKFSSSGDTPAVEVPAADAPDKVESEDQDEAMEVEELSAKDQMKESAKTPEVSAVDPAYETENEASSTVENTLADAPAAAAVSAKNDEDGLTKEGFVLHDDPRHVWTVEEDLRLLDGIRTHGLGNWSDISDTVSGQGSTAKTPKRCMERYLDDFLGRYGHILPQYTLQAQDDTNQVNAFLNADTVEDEKECSSPVPATALPVESIGTEGAATEPTEIRASKRRAVLLRSPSSVSNFSFFTRKKYKAIPTESVPGYVDAWPPPYVPEGVTAGQDVGREQSYKAEQTFVKMISQLENQAQVEELRREWDAAKLLKPGGPTVLPMRPEDVATLPGAELAGFMPRRGDFDIEWDNDAEQIVADMEFLPREPPQDRELKLKVLAIYNAKLEEREKRKRFVLSRKLYDYRTIQMEEQKLPKDERDLIHRMRLFERFHTPAEHQQFLADLLKAKRLRKEIAKLQMYRRIGIRTLAEAEMYELEKNRRAFHKTTQHQKAAESQKANESSAAAAASGTEVGAIGKASDETASLSLWKQYRTTDRKFRRSIARGGLAGDVTDAPTEVAVTAVSGSDGPDAKDATEAGGLSHDVSASIGGHSTTGAVTGDVGDIPAENARATAEEPASKTPSPTSPAPPDDRLTTLPGFELLSSREADLCRTLELTPQQYQEVKLALLQESLSHGLIDNNKDKAPSKRSVVLIDAERRGNVIDFMVRAGWINPKSAKSPRGSKTAAPSEG